MKALVILLAALALTGCVHIPEHCRTWGDPQQCAREHPDDEFFCDDTPERDPHRCGLDEGNAR